MTITSHDRNSQSFCCFIRLPQWQADKFIRYAVGDNGGFLSFHSEVFDSIIVIPLVGEDREISGTETSRYFPETISSMIKGILPRLLLLTVGDLFAKDRVNNMF